MHAKPLILLVLAALAVSAAPAAQPVDGATLRVLTYNIHHAEGLDKRIDLKRIAAVIQESKADIVALQEVDRGVKRTAGRDLPAELAALTGLNVYFERNITYQGGDYGNAVLTRFPIKQKKNTHYQMLRPGEQRGVLQLVLDIDGHDLLFLATHIDYRHDDAERLLNVDELKRIVDNAGSTPVILCGDFNDTPGSRTHTKLKTFLTDSWEVVGKGPGFSIPADKPDKRIDYIWITRPKVEPLGIRVIAADGSDHLPVAGEFRLKQ